MKSVKVAVAKETERFAKAKRMFSDNLEIQITLKCQRYKRIERYDKNSTIWN